jgi:hypothetical protein
MRPLATPSYAARPCLSLASGIQPEAVDAEPCQLAGECRHGAEQFCSLWLFWPMLLQGVSTPARTNSGAGVPARSNSSARSLGARRHGSRLVTLPRGYIMS